MKGKFIHNKFNSLKYNFKTIGKLTLIVYFISASIGWINFLYSNKNHRAYYPLRSYLITFASNEVTNNKNLTDIGFDLAGQFENIVTNIPYKLIDDLFYILICLLLIILFILGYKCILKNEISELNIIKYSILFSLIMTFSIPNNSSDIYGYIARGAQQTLYNQNPYFETVSEIKNFKSQPIFCNFMWSKTPTTYGPLFIYLTKVIVKLSNNSFFQSFLNFKLFNLVIFLFIIYFFQQTKDIKTLYIISWNPIVLIHGLWNGHNDLISGFLFFLGLYFLKKEKFFQSLFTLTICLGVKYISILTFPLILFYFIKFKCNRNTFINLVLGFICGILFILLFSLDYLNFSNQDFHKISHNLNLVHQSLCALAIDLIGLFYELENIIYIKYFFYITFIVFYVFSLFKFLKKDNLIQIISINCIVFLMLILPKFHSWYILNIILLFPLIENKFLKRLLVFLSLFHIFSITFIDQAKFLNYTFMTIIPFIISYIGEKNETISWDNA